MPRNWKLRGFARRCGWLVLSMVAIVVAEEPNSQATSSCTSQIAELDDYSTRLRWIRGRAAHRAAMRTADSLGKRLEFDQAQRRSATSAVTAVVRRFYEEWELQSYAGIDTDVTITLHLSADPDFEAAIAGLDTKVRVAVEAIAQPEQIARCLRYEWADANKEKLYRDCMDAICDSTPNTEWPPAAVVEYAQYLAVRACRGWGIFLEINRNQRLIAEKLFEDQWIECLSDCRDVMCPLFASFLCISTEVQTPNDPHYCRLYLPVLRRSQECIEEFEDLFMSTLTEPQKVFFALYINTAREDKRAQIGKMRAIIRRADAAKSATTQPTTQAVTREPTLVESANPSVINRSE